MELETLFYKLAAMKSGDTIDDSGVLIIRTPGACHECYYRTGRQCLFTNVLRGDLPCLFRMSREKGDTVYKEVTTIIGED